jgi:hypothetical protein
MRTHINIDYGTLEPTEEDLLQPTVVYPDKKPDAPVIFLDIDGVMSSERHNKWLHRQKIDNFRVLIFDPGAIAALNQLVHDTGALIVVTSSWRITRPLPWISKHFMRLGFAYPWNFIGTTVTGFDGDRGMQILDWIGKTELKHPYVVIDDSCKGIADNVHLADSFIKVDGKTGFAIWDYHDALNLLNGRRDKVFLASDSVAYGGRKARVLRRWTTIHIEFEDGTIKKVSRNNLTHRRDGQ